MSMNIKEEEIWVLPEIRSLLIDSELKRRRKEEIRVIRLDRSKQKNSKFHPNPLSSGSKSILQQNYDEIELVNLQIEVQTNGNN